MQQPTGPEFADCFDEATADYECCKAENSFQVSSPVGTVGVTDSNAIDRCYWPADCSMGSPNLNFASPPPPSSAPVAPPGFLCSQFSSFYNPSNGDDKCYYCDADGTSAAACLATAGPVRAIGSSAAIA